MIDDDRTLIASTRRQMGTSEDSTASVPEVEDVVPMGVRTLLENYPRPWHLTSDFIVDADGDHILQTRWSIGTPVAMLIVQAVNAFDVERQWKPTG